MLCQVPSGFYLTDVLLMLHEDHMLSKLYVATEKDTVASLAGKDAAAFKRMIGSLRCLWRSRCLSWCEQHVQACSCV